MSNVLLVDDDLENLCALNLALESSGHHVILAGSGREAMDKLAREPVQLIITDLEMPGMDGAELCRRVRCNPATALVPIIVLSAAPEPRDEPACWSMYFRKPADLPSLILVVERLAAERLTSASVRLACSDPAGSRWQPVNARCWP
ncbi:response regulator [Paraburkholderia terrae]|uniref:response regulator n=1 Tax=Paraburkholderia terrae TaxID=311230 RepID=UPI00296B2889|nr:response regulator [Paraburkholderia terrae]